MTGPIVIVCAMPAAFAASAVAGFAIRRGWVSIPLSLVLGAGVALAEIRCGVGPPALPGIVGYPIMCVVFNRVGAAVRRRVRSRRGKTAGEETAPPGE